MWFRLNSSEQGTRELLPVARLKWHSHEPVQKFAEPSCAEVRWPDILKFCDSEDAVGVAMARAEVRMTRIREYVVGSDPDVGPNIRVDLSRGVRDWD